MMTTTMTSLLISSSPFSSSSRGGGIVIMHFVLLLIVVLLLQSPFVWTWTTTTPSPSSRVTQQQQLQQQRVWLLDKIILPRKDGRLTILHERNDVENESNGKQQSQWLYNRLRLGKSNRDGATQLFASNADDNLVNDKYEEEYIEVNEVEEEEGEATIMIIADALTSPPQTANEVNEFVQKAQQAWTSPVNVVSKGMPLKGSILTGTTEQPESFKKKAPFFSTEKKLSTPGDTSFKKTLPPLSLKSTGDGGTVKKGLGLPPLTKKGLGDAAVAKKGFPSSPIVSKGGAVPITMKGPMSSKASIGDEGGSNTSSSASKGLPLPLPLKGGVSMGEKQAGLPGKGMPFMKKAPSFSMEKKTLPPLPLKGPGLGDGDGAGLKKGLGLPPLSKTSFGESGGGGAVVSAVKKGFPAAPLPLKGPMSIASDEVSSEKKSSVVAIEDVNTNGSNTNIDTKTNNTSNNSDEEAKYLALAKEAWAQFFAEQISEEDFVSMAMDAWKDASSVKAQNDVQSLQPIEAPLQSDTPSSVESQGEVGVKEDDNIMAVTNLKQDDASSVMSQQDDDRSQSDTPSVALQEVAGVQKDDDVKATDEEQGGINGAFSFLSGWKSSLFSGLNKLSGAPTSMGGGEDSSMAEDNEDDVPYGLRMKSSSASVVLPQPLSSATMDEFITTENVDDDALNNNVGTEIAKSVGETQVMPPPPRMSKGFTPPPMKSSGEKQAMPPLPISKGIAPSISKGIMKGEENSLNGGDRLSSMPPPSLDKGGVKIGIQGKFAPKTVTKKNWQGNRGGLSFLKSDILSMEYKADTNYNQMNKGVTAEKIKEFKVGQVDKAKESDDAATARKNFDVKDVLESKLNAVDLPPVTELMSDGITAEEAERIRMRRLQTEEERALNPIYEPVQTNAIDETVRLEDTRIAITEGMTAEEAERARMARLEISDTIREVFKTTNTGKKGEAGTLPLTGTTSTASDTLNVSKDTPLKGEISSGVKQQPDKVDLKATARPGKTDDSESKLNAVDLPPVTELMSDGITAEEAERIRMRRLQTEEERALNPIYEPVQTNAIDETVRLEDTRIAITEGMTAEEAERARMARLEISDTIREAFKTTNTGKKGEAGTLNRMLTEEEKVSKSFNERVEPEVTPVAIAEGMTAEEAERARMARYTSTIDATKQQLQAGVQQKQQKQSNKISQVGNPTASTTAPPQPVSESTKVSEERQLKEKIALLESKTDDALSHISNLEDRVAVLDEENIQLRLENSELRKEFEELKRTMEERLSLLLSKELPSIN